VPPVHLEGVVGGARRSNGAGGASKGHCGMSVPRA
jgi:hypothetical protein